MKKTICVSLVLVFLATQVVFAHKPSLSSLPPMVPTGFQSNKLSAPLVKALPQSLWSHLNIKTVHSTPGAKSVLLIEDLHQNLEAQTHISETLRSFGGLSGEGSTLVALEGAAGGFVFNRFRSFPSDKVRTMADSYLNKIAISGPAHAGFMFRPDAGKKDLFFWGVEDRTLYRRNVAAYRASRDIQSKTAARLETRARDIDEQKKLAFNPALLSLDNAVRSYRDGSLSLAAYARALDRSGETTSLNVDVFLQATAMEKVINFPLVEHQRARVLEKLVKKISKTEVDNLMNMSLGYQQGVVTFGDYYAYLRKLCEKAGVALASAPAFDNYIRYVLLADGVDASRLFTDIVAMEQSAYARLAKTEREKRLAALSTQLYLARQLVQFGLTSEQWAQYQQGRALLDGQFDLSTFEDFYVAADLRNEAMVSNLAKKIENDAVMVAGGFHTQGLTDLFKKNGLSYVVATPKITKIDEDAPNPLSVFDREKKPLQKLFSGKKLFLAAPVGFQAGEPLLEGSIDPSKAIWKDLGGSDDEWGDDPTNENPIGAIVRHVKTDGAIKLDKVRKAPAEEALMVTWRVALASVLSGVIAAIPLRLSMPVLSSSQVEGAFLLLAFTAYLFSVVSNWFIHKWFVDEHQGEMILKRGVDQYSLAYSDNYQKDVWDKWLAQINRGSFWFNFVRSSVLTFPILASIISFVSFQFFSLTTETHIPQFSLSPVNLAFALLMTIGFFIMSFQSTRFFIEVGHQRFNEDQKAGDPLATVRSRSGDSRRPLPVEEFARKLTELGFKYDNRISKGWTRMVDDHYKMDVFMDENSLRVRYGIFDEFSKAALLSTNSEDDFAYVQYCELVWENGKIDIAFRFDEYWDKEVVDRNNVRKLIRSFRSSKEYRSMATASSNPFVNFDLGKVGSPYMPPQILLVMQPKEIKQLTNNMTMVVNGMETPVGPERAKENLDNFRPILKAKEKKPTVANSPLIVGLIILGLIALPPWESSAFFLAGVMGMSFWSLFQLKQTDPKPKVVQDIPPVKSEDTTVRRLMELVPSEKMFDTLSDALDKVDAKGDGESKVIQYLVTSKEFDRSLDDILTIANRYDSLYALEKSKRPEFVITAVGLSEAQKDEIAWRIRAKVPYKIIVGESAVVDLDQVLREAARVLPRVRRLLDEGASSGVKLVTISNGVPFVASPWLREIMKNVIIDIEGKWAVVPVETAVRAYIEAANKA